MSELKPCPFCGGSVITFTSLDTYPGYYTVRCLGCDAARGGTTEAAALAAWNRRAPSAEAEMRERAARAGEDAVAFPSDGRDATEAEIQLSADIAAAIRALPLAGEEK